MFEIVMLYYELYIIKKTQVRGMAIDVCVHKLNVFLADVCKLNHKDRNKIIGEYSPFHVVWRVQR